MLKTFKAKTKLLICLAIVLLFSNLFIASFSYASEKLDPEDGQYLEFRSVSIQEVDGQGKQMIAELWAYNLDFISFEVRIGYDKEKVQLSDLITNEGMTTDNFNGLNAFYNDSSFGDDFKMEAIEYTDTYIRYVFSLFPPFESGNTHLVSSGWDRYLTVGEEGVCLGKFSFRLLGDNIDGETFTLLEGENMPATGIKIMKTDTEYYEERSTFRFNLQSDDNNLTNIKIDGESIEDFDKDITDYDVEMLVDKENIRLQPIIQDDKATIKVYANKREDEDNPGEYIYDEIQIDDELGDYEIPLKGLGEETEIIVEVTAENGDVKEYVVVINQPCGYMEGKISTANKAGEHVANIWIFNTGEVDWTNIGDFRDKGALIIEGIAIKSITTKDDGTFSIRLPKGEYDILIDKEGYLDCIVTNIEIAIDIGTNIDEIEIYAGDLNKSGLVDVLDLALLYASYRKMPGEEDYLSSANFNADGMVDILDLAILYESYRVSFSVDIYI